MNIVSFLAPRPDHPFFRDYTPFLDLLRLSCERFGHRHLVLTDDPKVGDDAYVTDLPHSLMRATVAAQLAYLSDPQFADVPTLLTGADCVLANDPARMARAADIVITTDDRFQDCRMNCGAIYIPRPALLAPVWADALDRCGDLWGDDQTSVYSALLMAPGVTVAELPCDPHNLAPNHPGDDCRRATVLHFRGPRKDWMVDYCHKWLGLGEGVTVHAAPNTEDAALLANVRVNSRRALPWVEQGADRGHAVLVGGGPSLADTIEEVRRRWRDGQTIFALNGVAKYLIGEGITPEYGVILDPRADNARFIVPGVGEWLLASQCHPDVFEAAASETASVWHFATEGLPDMVPPEHGSPLMVGGGITVGITVMGLAFAMGFRELHLYGYDSSDRDTEAHAYRQGEDDAESKRVQAWCEGREFTCGVAMLAQAQAFPQWAALLAEAGATITVHGDGLLPTIAHSMHVAAIKDMAA